jgi:hypothetical protein
MHAVKLLHKTLEQSSIHQSRLKPFLLAGESLLKGNQLTVTGLGRSIVNSTKTKHNINRMNRLVGNEGLYEDAKVIYQSCASWLINSKKHPVILVDWSGATSGDRYQLLRASLAMEGRALTLYEEIHELSDYNKKSVHNSFLDTLKDILPSGCKPIIVTDAGFSTPWFHKVLQLGWEFISRINNTSGYTDENGNKGEIWDLLEYQRAQVKNIGRISLTKRHELPCYLQVYKKPKKYRVCLTTTGKRSARSVSLKAAQREKEPWIIVSSVGGTYTQARKVMKIYELRMQIEESFRDLKSHYYGVGLRYTRTKGIVRLSNLMLIAFVAMIMAWLIGLCAKNKKMQYAFQANTIRTRNVLSVIFLAKEVIKHNKAKFRRKEWDQALVQLQEHIQYA